MLDQFEDFEQGLYEANEVMNLTRVPREQSWSRHFLDSLLLAPLLPEGAKVADLGCGPGFPSWPLAVARPDLRVTALDSSGKMLSFLAHLPLDNLEIVQGRAEEWGRREKYDIVTGRALAPLAIQLEVSAAWTRIGGAVIPMRTAGEEFDGPDEEVLGLKFERIVKGAVTIGGAERAFPIYRKVRATPRALPRRWAEIRSTPLMRPTP